MSGGSSRVIRARYRLARRGLLPCERRLLAFLLIRRRYRRTRRRRRRRMFDLTCLACLVIARRLGPWLGMLAWPRGRRRGRSRP